MNNYHAEIVKSFIDHWEKSESFVESEMNSCNNENFKRSGRQSVINVEIMRRFRIQNKKLMEQVAWLKDQLKYANTNQEKIKRDMNMFMTLNSELAKAVGGCAECWGENYRCKHCNGSGIPGWKNGNKKHFKNVVIPLLKILFPIETKK